MLTGADRVRKGVPGEAIGGNDMLDDIVIGEGEVEEMELVAVREDLDIPDFRQAESARCVHVRSLPDGWRHCYREGYGQQAEFGIRSGAGYTGGVREPVSILTRIVNRNRETGADRPPHRDQVLRRA